MNMIKQIKTTSIMALATLGFSSSMAQAQSRVLIETNMGDIYLKLYDTQAPITVQNFLGYVERGDYDNTIFHRAVNNFILQTGGFEVLPGNGILLESSLVNPVTTQAPIQNEPGISNVRGTIAMAKLGGDPNSATSQWFVNFGDNSANLDSQNGGFTVFGEVEDMTIVDQILGNRISNSSAVHGALGELPIVDADHADSSDPQNPSEVEVQDLVRISSASLISNSAPSVPEPSSSVLVLAGAGICVLRRKR